ncbi:PD40 domain-containing protein [bacterium]|nr:PD40 domain-containing protein [bacterium]
MDPVARRVLPAILPLLAGMVVGAASSSLPTEPGVEEIIFACRPLGGDPHWYANFGYSAGDAGRKFYTQPSRLCRLHLSTHKVSVLLEDRQGSIRDPQVHYDGRKILFSYRKGGTDHFHLYEIGADGGNLRQLTDGPFDDIEPTYLPDGGIMFASSRCRRWVNCWFSQVAVLYRCDADGGGLHPVSANIEHDNTPWPLPDGRVIYQRWEYVDRSQVSYHHLWSMNPDGTGQMIYFGNQRPRTVILDAKPIPGSDNEVVAVFSPGHGKKEHNGVVTIVSPKTGPDTWESARSLHPGDDFRDPYPLSPDCFLVAQGPRLVVMNGKGELQEIYRLPTEEALAGMECHEPRPLASRPRERILPSRVHLDQSTGRRILADVYNGRRMEGVRRGEIRKLLVLETLPKPVNYSGGMEPLSLGGTFTLERVLGTVPVEADGSAYMELPALRSLFFVALDENNNSVKRMQSFFSVMPGETGSCAGCHEQRTRAPVNPGRGALLALQRPPSRIEPVPHIPDVFDFPRDIQPILDRHCLRCHDYERRSGGVVLSGDRGPMYSQSYVALTVTRQFADGRNRQTGNLPPRAIGSSASPLLSKLAGSHHDVRASSRELDMVRYWIETGAPYPGTYAALGSGIVSLNPLGGLNRADQEWPEARAARAVMARRCDSCHEAVRPLPHFISDDRRDLPRDSDRRPLSYHLAFNLSRPHNSLLLRAPLAKSAGGYGACLLPARKGSTGDDRAVFQSTGDPDYRTLLELCRAGQRELERIKRFDMPGFRPTPAYVRELQRFGVLPRDLAPDAAFDVYALDQAYWRSLWYRPAGATAARE